MNSAFVILIGFIICSTFNGSCEHKKNETHKITKAFIKVNQQIVDTTGISILNFPDSILLFSSGGYSILYFYKLKKYFNVVSNDKSDSLILIKEEKQWFSFVYKEGFENGLFFDSLINGTPAVLNTDSILRKHTPKLSIASAGLLDYWEQKSEATNSSIITETYISKSKNDYGNTDTLKLFYSDEYKEINYNLSEELTSRKKHRLFKYSLVISETYDVVRKGIVPKRELFIEMGKINIEEAERKKILEAIKLFDNEFNK
jgi:hypothetical protein